MRKAEEKDDRRLREHSIAALSFLPSHEAEVYMPSLDLPSGIRLLHRRDEDMIVQTRKDASRLKIELSAKSGH